MIWVKRNKAGEPAALREGWKPEDEEGWEEVTDEARPALDVEIAAAHAKALKKA